VQSLQEAHEKNALRANQIRLSAYFKSRTTGQIKIKFGAMLRRTIGSNMV
jgi:hypothetical protein